MPEKPTAIVNERVYTYHDAQLRSLPLRLLNCAGAGVAAFGWRVPTLQPDDIIAAAMARTGLALAADDSAREPLRQYVAAAESDANLNTLGRLAARNMLVNALSQRLRIIDWCRQRPAVANERIERPWIVIGLPRTGTSLLSLLLALDPSCRPLLQWEAARPMPPAQLAGAGDDPRIALFNRDVGQAMRLNPALGALHPFGSLLAEECTALFMFSLRTIGMETIAFVPGYGRWLADADMQPAYAIHKMVLQAFQSAQPTERWVLKSPNHLWHLEQLLATYPDARIVWMHRDPAALVTSLASLNNAMQRPFTRAQQPAVVAEYWADKIADGINSASRFDAAAVPGWCHHLHYDDLMADPLGSVEKIYKKFDMALTSLQRRRMQAWLRQRPQNVFGKHAYDARDFGWTLPQLHERYGDYRQRYGVRAAFA
jgi:hypothetical protein